MLYSLYSEGSAHSRTQCVFFDKSLIHEIGISYFSNSKKIFAQIVNPSCGTLHRGSFVEAEEQKLYYDA